MSLMREEIAEQPGVIARLASDIGPFREAATAVRAAGIRFVLFAARGTSDHAATYGLYLAGIHAGLAAGLATPSVVTRYGAALDLRGALVLGISQSGETPDVAEFVARAAEAGAVTVAVTNDEGSTLARSAAHVLATRAGEERAVAATKTYTSQLAALALFFGALADDQGLLAPMAEEIPAAMEAALEGEVRAVELAERLVGAERLLVIGRGYGYPTALETALKLAETAYLSAAPYSAADFMHGPIAVAGHGLPAVVFASPGPTHEQLVALAADLVHRGSRVAVVAPDPAAFPGTFGVPVPDAPEALSPLVQAIPAQLLACHLAPLRGGDPDRPRGLTKITRTR